MKVTLLEGENSADYQAKLAVSGITPYLEDFDHIRDLDGESTDWIYMIPLEFTNSSDWSEVRARLAGANRYFIVVGENLTSESIITHIRDGAFDVLDLKDTDARWMSSIHEANSSQDLWWQLYGGYSGKQDDDLVGRSAGIQSLKQSASIIGPTNASVMILGESGAGKERVAQAIHNASGRKTFIPVNCAAIPKDLIESELFGVEKGAYTGAVAAKKGLIQEADGGTLFLDEIGELDIMLQPKLLRFLETRKARRLGSNAEYSVDIRIVTATNRDLEADIANGVFRADLYYRISEVILNIPPLRARLEDIPILAQTFLKMSVERFGKSFEWIEPELINKFQNHVWPGNVRELKQSIDRLVILNNGQTLLARWWEVPLRSHGVNRPAVYPNSPVASNPPWEMEPPPPQTVNPHYAPPPPPSPPPPPPPTPARDDISMYLQGAPPNKKDRYKHAQKLLEQSDNDFAWVAARMGIHPTTLYRWRLRKKV
ncbi:MAG: sigma 54-interacting transcriptional regulator [Verrucomicrobia bacterium]|nr:sigma 54-interacting transcriptional regulator [Verrucomicrobiota bacterium]MDA1064999.1 sigma 54-interacting transcriptional regulator [Verrucomicrobiota bacterium]